MTKFISHTGIAAPLLHNNIDTDAIIPSREMKAVSKLGLASGLFAQWRYTDEKTRELNPNFVLNQAPYKGASILVSGSNFGCGSSREHAVWALKEFGIRSIIAHSFGSIFFSNCVRNGVLPIQLSESEITQIATIIACDSKSKQLRISLQDQTVCLADGSKINFTIANSDREMLIEGLDPIAVTQKLDPQIQAFADRDKRQRPWVYSEA